MRFRMELVPGPSLPDFDAVLERLRVLSRNHLLFFRVEVGRVVAEAFYGGDVDRYRGRTGELGLKQFLAQRDEALRDLGLGPQTVRQCLLAWQVFADLPEDLRLRMVYSHVVALAQLDDGESRRLLARAALDNGWSGDDLRRAIEAVRAGRWIDAEPEVAGLQPPEPEPKPAPEPVSVGWAVRRAEKTARVVDALAVEWEAMDVGRLTPSQRERALAAARDLKARAERLEGRLLGARGVR